MKNINLHFPLWVPDRNNTVWFNEVDANMLMRDHVANFILFFMMHTKVEHQMAPRSISWTEAMSLKRISNTLKNTTKTSVEFSEKDIVFIRGLIDSCRVTPDLFIIFAAIGDVVNSATSEAVEQQEPITAKEFYIQMGVDVVTVPNKPKK